jgi:hypothetical protein
MSAFDLARWFTIPEDASGAGDDFIREDILGDLYANARAVGIHEGTVLVETERGMAMIERDPRDIVVFDYVENDRWRRVRFWMNASSVRDLGERLRALPRRPFDEMFTGATTTR